MFQPKTNFRKQEVFQEHKPPVRHTEYAKIDEGDLITFEQSKEYNQGDYDLYKIQEDERMDEMERDFELLKQKKAKLEKVSNELLNLQCTQSTSEENQNQMGKGRTYKGSKNQGSYEY